MRHYVTLCLLATALSTSGCYAVRYSQGDLGRVDLRGAEVHKTWSHSLVWGLASANEIDVDALCGLSGAAELRSSYGPFGLFAQVVTLGFWTPLRVKVTCRPDTRPVIAESTSPLAIPATGPGREDRVVVVPDNGARTIIIVD